MLDTKQAARLNRYWARVTSPPWFDRFYQVAAELGIRDMSPTDETFVAAVRGWQQKQGGLAADGVMGPKSWKLLEPSTRYSIDLSRVPPPWVAAPDQTGGADEATSPPQWGSIPYAVGQSSIVRIPVPGTGGLAVELSPRGFVPKGGSTSSLFIQDATGKRHLRLDFGYNKQTRSIDYHWNQQGTNSNFGIADHTSAGRTGRAIYNAAKYFRYAGRMLVVAGVAIDAVSIVVADRPLRRASQVASAWALAWLGCKGVGAAGALAGSFAPGPGTAVGGIAGCIAGGYGGYKAGQALGGEVYDWAADTLFTPLPEVARP